MSIGSGKMLLFDIDGTLFDDCRNLPGSVLPALQEAGRRGHQIIINTGRTLCNMDHRLDDFPLDGWIMGCGTRVIYHGRTMRSMEYELPQSLILRKAMLQIGIPVVYECDTAIYFDPEVPGTKEIQDFRKYAERVGIARDIDEKDPEFRAVKMFCFGEKGKIREIIKRTGEIGMPYEAIYRGPGAWEVVPGGYSKGTGADWLRSYLGIPKEDCYAFGDSRNDLTMFAHAGHSIAMGNATEDVRAVCSYVTERPENDGIARALRHFGLIG